MLLELGIAPVGAADEADAAVEWVRPDGFATWQPQRPIALINGAFDLLHVGHLRIVRYACQHAPVVVAAVDSDRKVAEAKGPPVMTWVERATALGLVGIPYTVEIDTEEDMRTLIRTLRPDFRVQGEHYKDRPSRFSVPRVFIRQGGISTTEIVRRCAGRAGTDVELTKWTAREARRQ